MVSLLRRYWFMLLLAAIMATGMFWAEACDQVAADLPRDWIVGCVMFLTALPLCLDTLKNTLKYPRPIILALVVNFCVVPVLAWLASFLLMPELALGTVIASAVPCTLASAAVWTRMAGGNDAISLMVTVITNLCCCFSTPALIDLFGGRSDVHIDFGQIATKLFFIVALPLIFAQVLRRITSLGDWATRHKQSLSIFAQLGLLCIVFIGAVKCGMQIVELGDRIAKIGFQLGLMMVLVAAVHIVAWAVGFFLAGRLGIPRAEQIAVGFAGSQKTLMVGLAIALHFGGLAMLPMLAYHVEQLLIDTFLADRLRTKKLEV